MNEQIKQRITQLNNGEIPNGYKKTEFGVFPCDWSPKTIGEVSTEKGCYGLNAPACDYEEGLPKYLRITDIDENGNYLNNDAYVNHKDSKNYILQENDIVFARTGASVGKNYLYSSKDGELSYAGFLIKFSIDETKCVPYMVKANCRGNRYDKWVQIMSARSGQPGINAEEYADFSLMIPNDFKEQSKISEILMKWDEAIELQEKQLDNLKVKKDAILQRLIKKDDSWVKIGLRDILKERTEFATKDEGYPHVTLSKSGVAQKTEQYNREFLVKSEDKKYKITRYNDICYNPANLKFGVICINKLTEESIFSPIYITYEVDPKYNVDFIGAVLCSTDFIRYIRKYEEGTVYERQAVKSSDFLRGEIWVPSTKGEQDKIASIIKKIDDYIGVEHQKYEALCTQRKALQQYLLNGIVRV